MHITNRDNLIFAERAITNEDLAILFYIYLSKFFGVFFIEMRTISSKSPNFRSELSINVTSMIWHYDIVRKNYTRK